VVVFLGYCWLLFKMSLSVFQVASSIGLCLWPERRFTWETDRPEFDQGTLVQLISGRITSCSGWYRFGFL
jgi:hypothetical protein